MIVVVADLDTRPLCSESRACALLARTLKPMMTRAGRPEASVTSALGDRHRRPGAWMTRPSTSSVLSFSSAPVIASAEP